MRFAPKPQAPMSAVVAARLAPVGFGPLRFALRELRGGLRGFYVFIACIALGVMAIAGVGSFARSLTDGLAREGRVILGGDLSFSLIQREASAAERAFLERAAGSRPPRPCARWRAPPTAHGAGRDQGGRWRLSAVRRGRRSTPTCRSPPRWRSATARSAPLVDPALLARLGLKPGARLTIGGADRNHRRAQERAGQARRRHRVRAARSS